MKPTTIKTREMYEDWCNGLLGPAYDTSAWVRLSRALDEIDRLNEVLEDLRDKLAKDEYDPPYEVMG